jgi:hypothetical protein
MMTRSKITAVAASAGILVLIGIAYLFSPTSGGGGKAQSTFSLFDGSAARASPLTAMPRLAPLDGRNARAVRSRSAAVRARFLRLAQQDKYRAIDAALRLPAADRDLALATLAAAWRTDPRRGYQELSQVIDRFFSFARYDAAERPGSLRGIGAFMQHGDDLSRSLTALARLPDDPELPLLALRLTNRFFGGSDEKRAGVLNSAAMAYAGVDPALAFSFGSTLKGVEYQVFVDMFSKGWSDRDPEAAAQWASSIGDPSLRIPALANAVRFLAARDPGRAAQWLETLPDGSARAGAIRQLGSAWARNDTAAALAWAGQLPDSAAQQQAVAAIQAVAPVGVGISLGRPGPGGYPSAMDLVPSGPAAAGGGVQRGDQIVAVSNLGNEWVGTQNMPIEQVIALIRGTAGAPVQLRVLPRGATDPAQARVVTIVRQQILFKRTPVGG